MGEVRGVSRGERGEWVEEGLSDARCIVLHVL